jgi:uncharacterized RmlC-like cupin family protein
VIDCSIATRRIPVTHVHPRQPASRGGQLWLCSAVFVGARNEPTAQESVMMYPELDGAVP